MTERFTGSQNFQTNNQWKPGDYLLATIMSAAVLQILFYVWRYDINAWDGLGHLYAAKDFRDGVGPWLSGWSTYGFGGYPIGYFYPQLFEWCVGNFAHVMPLEVSYRFFLSVSLVALPYSIWLFLSDLKYSSRSILLALSYLFIFFLFFDGPTSLGGTLKGTFIGGLASAQFSLPLYFFYLRALNRMRQKQAAIFEPGLFMGLCILSHGFTALAAALSSIVYFFCYFYGQTRTSLVKYAGHIIISSLIASAWLVPFFAYHDYSSGIVVYAFNAFTIFKLAPLLGVVHGLILLAVLINYRTTLTRHDPVLLLLVTFTFICAASKFMVASSYLHVPFHIYRLLIFPIIFSCLLCGGASSRVKLQLLTNLVMSVLIVAGCVYAKLNFFQFRHRKVEIPLTSISPQVRGIVIVGGHDLVAVRSAAPLLVVSEFYKNNYQVLNGVFVESSLISPYYYGIAREMSSSTTGKFAEEKPVNTSELARHLEILGIGWALTSEVAPAPYLDSLPPHKRGELNIPVTVNDQTELYHYSLFKFSSRLVEFYPSPPIFYHGAHKGWHQLVEKYWSSGSNFGIPVKIENISAQEDSWSPPQTQEKVEISRLTTTAIDVHIDARAPRWVNLKFPYFPRWQAVSSGRPLPLFRSGPGFISFFSANDVALRFEHATWELALHLLSLSTTIISLFLIFRECD